MDRHDLGEGRGGVLPALALVEWDQLTELLSEAL
jgi:hypothetical protein